MAEMYGRRPADWDDTPLSEAAAAHANALWQAREQARAELDELRDRLS